MLNVLLIPGSGTFFPVVQKLYTIILIMKVNKIINRVNGYVKIINSDIIIN